MSICLQIVALYVNLLAYGSVFDAQRERRVSKTNPQRSAAQQCILLLDEKFETSDLFNAQSCQFIVEFLCNREGVFTRCVHNSRR